MRVEGWGRGNGCVMYTYTDTYTTIYTYIYTYTYTC